MSNFAQYSFLQCTFCQVQTAYELPSLNFYQTKKTKKTQKQKKYLSTNLTSLVSINSELVVILNAVDSFLKVLKNNALSAISISQ